MKTRSVAVCKDTALVQANFVQIKSVRPKSISTDGSLISIGKLFAGMRLYVNLRIVFVIRLFRDKYIIDYNNDCLNDSEFRNGYCFAQY